MAEKILMFALSPTMDTGTIVKWNKKEGDTISLNEAICEVETDKSSMDYESMNAGVLLKIVVAEGQSAGVGQAIAVAGQAGEDISALLEEIEKEKGSKTSTPSAEPAATPSSSATASISSSTNSAVVPSTEENTNANTDSDTRIVASPLARKLCQERSIDIRQIRGTGPGGRITKSDVEQFTPVAAMANTGISPAIANTKDIITPVKGVRAIIAKRLSESKFSAPHFYVKNTVRTESMMSLRAQINAAHKEKLSLNAFIIKFVAEAIKQHPSINSSWQEENIVQYASIDISLAVDLGAGLFTPVVRNCGNKGIAQIDSELKILIEKVRDKTIAAEEYTGATFTISNLGSFGVDEFTAIINPPGAAILAIGRGRNIPVVSDKGTIEVGNAMTITLSSDHRVIDGSLAGRFIAKLQGIIENPGIALV